MLLGDLTKVPVQVDAATKTLKSLSGRSSELGELGMLRVLVSFTEELDSSHLPSDVDIPVAILNMQSLREATKSYDSKALALAIMARAIANDCSSALPKPKRRIHHVEGAITNLEDVVEHPPLKRQSKRSSKGRAVEVEIESAGNKERTRRSKKPQTVQPRSTPPVTRAQAGPRRSARLNAR